MSRKSRIVASAAVAFCGMALLAPTAVKALDSWQRTRKQAWIEQATAALKNGTEELPPIPFGVQLVDDPDEVKGEEQDDPAARELQQLLLFRDRTPEAQLELLRIAQAEKAKETAISQALAQNPAAAATLAPVVSTIVANNVGPAGARSEYNGSYYKAQDTGRVRAIRVHPTDANTVFVATAGGGLWKTQNFHTVTPTWVPLTDSVVGSIDLGAMDVDPSNPNVLYVGTGENGDALPGGAVMKSTDGGATWQAPVLLSGRYLSGNLAIAQTAVQVRSIAVDPNDSNTVMAATNVGLFRSVDAGTTFAIVDMPNLPAYNFNTTTFNTGLKAAWDVVYLGSAGGKSQFMVSGDYACPGFAPPNRGNHVPNCAAATGIPTLPTTGTVGDVWKSLDGGATWTSMRMAGKLPTQAATWGAAGSDSANLGDLGRIAISAAPNADPSLSSVYAMGASVSDAASVTILLFNTRDGGATWNKLATSKSTNLTNPTISTRCRTLDLGHNQSWYDLGVAVDPGNPDRAIMGGNLCGARTIDGGQTWQLAAYWLPSSGSGDTQDGAGALPYVHADWHTALVSRSGGRYVTLVGCDGGIHSSYNVFDMTPTQLASWNQPDYGLITHLPYGHGTGDPVLGNAQVFYAGFQDNGTRWRLSHTEAIFIPTLGNWDQIVGGDGTGNGVSSDANGQNQVYWGGLPNLNTFCRPTPSRDCGSATRIVDGNEVPNWSRTLPTLPAGDAMPFTLRYSPTYDAAGSMLAPSTFNLWRVTVDANDVATWTRLTPAGFTGGRNTQLQGAYASPFTYQINGVTTRIYGAVVTGGAFAVFTDTGTGIPTQTVSGQMRFAGTAVTGSSTVAFPRVPLNLCPPQADGSAPLVTRSFIGATVNPSPDAMGKIFKTCDNGATWIPIHGNGTAAPGGGTLDLPNIPVYVVRIDYGDPSEKTIYVGTELGLYRTTDGGNTWARYGSVPAARIIDLTVSLNGSLVRASAYGRGLWEMYPHSEVGSALGDGDWDRNGVIDFRDLLAAASRLGRTPAQNSSDPNDFANYYQPRYDAALDANGDGALDDQDLGSVITKFGGTP